MTICHISTFIVILQDAGNYQENHRRKTPRRGFFRKPKHGKNDWKKVFRASEFRPEDNWPANPAPNLGKDSFLELTCPASPGAVFRGSWSYPREFACS